MGSYMKDGVRKVDLILVYSNAAENNSKKAVKHQSDGEKRNFFQNNLIKSGLELEVERVDDDQRLTLTFVKIHTPWPTLCKYAEHLQIKTPLWITDRPVIKRRKIFEPPIEHHHDDEPGYDADISEKSEKRKHQRIVKQPINVPFEEQHLERFAVRDKATYFSELQRITIAFEILEITPNNPKEPKKRGIDNLLEEGVYESVYPLHDGDIESYDNEIGTGEDIASDKKSASGTRQRLYLREKWASWKNIGRKQPLTAIRNYFGEKVGFYYAFMEMYTYMLFFPTLVGLITFVIGIIATAYNPEHGNLCITIDDSTGNETVDPFLELGLPASDSDNIADYWMCPICKPPNCDPWQMGYDGCFYYGWAFRVDNPWSFLLSGFTAVWATVFLKIWRRREYALSIEWNSHDADDTDTVMRPEYEAKATEERSNPITRESEPYIPFKKRSIWLFESIFATGLFLTLACALVILLVICRIYLYAWLKNAPGKIGAHHVDVARWLSHGLLFVLVTILEKIYEKVAHFLTNHECPKTEKQFMNSLLWKLFLFAMLSDIIPIGYTAWVKGRTTGTPLDLTAIDELCDGGCMGEVTELVAVLLILRLIVGNITEIGVPLFKHWFQRVWRSKKRDDVVEKMKVGQHIKDYHLATHEHDGVYEDLLEMTIQFAFIVLFIPALPVAPLVCLLNNVAEIRVDGMKMIQASRRPLPLHTAGLGVWNRFLDIINKLGVLSNAALLAFTSDNVPYFYYRFIYQPGYGYVGFIKYTLSRIYTEHFDDDAQRVFRAQNISECWYPGFRQPYRPFEATEMYWEITALRLAIFSLYCLAFFIFIWVVNSFISDEPSSVKTKIKRQEYILKKAVEAEAEHKRKHILAKMSQKRKGQPYRRRGTLD